MCSPNSVKVSKCAKFYAELKSVKKKCLKRASKKVIDKRVRKNIEFSLVTVRLTDPFNGFEPA